MKVGLDGRGKVSWMVCLSFVKHGLYMVLWTWPSGCRVHQSGGQGQAETAAVVEEAVVRAKLTEL